MAYCCFKCGKQIRGEMKIHVPTILAIQVAGDFEKAYHPKCFEKAEKAAAKELHKENIIRDQFERSEPHSSNSANLRWGIVYTK